MTLTFKEQLILMRKQKGLSQEQLGALIGVSRQTISKWELGDTTPEMDKLIQLSSLFEISIDKLVGHSLDGYEESNESISPDSTNPKNNINHFHPYTFHYEYKSSSNFRGVPLVHINVGRGIYKAKGVIAIGNIARGFISLGVVSTGLISFGAISFGILSFGALALSLLLSIGAIAVGSLAIGGLAIGIFAVGGCAIGIYAIGGAAFASNVALGGYAHAPIAIGDKTSGDVTFNINQAISQNEISNAILQKYPHTWKFIVDLFEFK